MNNQWFSKVAVWLVIALVLFTVFKQFDRGATQGNQIGYSDFLEEVRARGLSILVTELDVLDSDGPSNIAQRDRAVADEARRLGLASVGLSHAVEEGHAGAFYEKLGYTYTGVVDDDERFMLLEL